jgi:hypothetical protein
MPKHDTGNSMHVINFILINDTFMGHDTTLVMIYNSIFALVIQILEVQEIQGEPEKTGIYQIVLLNLNHNSFITNPNLRETHIGVFIV